MNDTTSKATTASASSGPCADCGSQRPLHDLDCPVARRVTAPSRDAAPHCSVCQNLEAQLRAVVAQRDAALARAPLPDDDAIHRLHKLREEIAIMYQMLDDGEWAEHIAVTPEGQNLETAISKLVGKVNAASAPLPAQIVVPEWVYRSARDLAVSIWRDNYKTTVPNWEPLDDLAGVISQIDNMVAGMRRTTNVGAVRRLSERLKWMLDADQFRNVEAMLSAIAAPDTETAAHPDDAAVDRFATAMKEKMAASRAKGRNGWDNEALCPAGRLQSMLIDHLAKGDPVDVGNFAMMLWNRGEPVAAPAKAGDAPATDEKLLELLREADDLLFIASDAMLKMGLRDKGSDCGLPHEVRRFALEFSNEGRDGPGALQVRGTGRYRAWLTAARKIDRAAMSASQDQREAE